MKTKSKNSLPPKQKGKKRKNSKIFSKWQKKKNDFVLQ